MSFQIVRNDITKMRVDAIVNTAEPSPGYGAGVDTAVYEAAGRERLLAKRREIGEIAPGESALTPGYDLPAKYIIHTVGTAWLGGGAGEEEIIRSCYRSVFGIARAQGIGSLAIPLLASGSFGFPKEIALRIALSEIEAFQSESDMELYLVVFDSKSVSLSEELYGDIDAYINDNYVDDKSSAEYPEIGSSRESVCFAALPESDHIPRRKRLFASRALRADVANAAPRSLDDAIRNLDKTFMEMVFSYADERGMTDVEVQKRAFLDRKAFSKLKCGTTRNPSKSTALALAVALRLNLDETKDLLARAGLALSPCSKQDVIVQYFIEREAYDIYEINVALFDHGEPQLGTQVC